MEFYQRKKKRDEFVFRGETFQDFEKYLSAMMEYEQALDVLDDLYDYDFPAHGEELETGQYYFKRG